MTIVCGLSGDRVRGHTVEAGPAVPRDRRDVAGAVADRPEEVEVDGGLQRRRSLVRLQHFEHESGSQRAFGPIPRVHLEPPFQEGRHVVWLNGCPSSRL